MPAPPRTARERGRAELSRAILDAARRQLAEVGAAALSLRSVARELGLASSAVYRYYPSRDALLTALIVEAYDAIGDAAESADAEAAEAGAGGRWLAVCRAVRAWALAHPLEFALVYGSPVPGYAAPPTTVAPASRVGLLLARLMTSAVENGEVRPPARTLPGPRLTTAVVAADAGPALPPPYEDLVERAIVMWIALFGALTFELFGHLNNVVTDYAAYFDAAMAVAAEGAGLELPLSG